LGNREKGWHLVNEFAIRNDKRHGCIVELGPSVSRRPERLELLGGDVVGGLPSWIVDQDSGECIELSSVLVELVIGVYSRVGSHARLPRSMATKPYIVDDKKVNMASGLRRLMRCTAANSCVC